MFGGLLSIRMKAAERALRQGQLDDALRIAGEPDIAGHARGGRLLAGLARAFIARARGHYRAERFTEALLDLGEAERCGAPDADIAELRGQITIVAREVARQGADRRRRVEQAKRYIDNGSLAAGKRLLHSAATGDEEMAQIQKDIQNREKRAADLLAQAEALYRAKRIAAAVDHLERAMRLDAHNEPAMRLESQVCAQVVKEARAAFDAGRLHRAETELAGLGTLGRHDDARAELAELLRHATQAARALAAGEFETAQHCVRRLHQLAPKTSWVKQAVAEMNRLDAALLNLRSGPLGESSKTAKPPRVNLQDTIALARPARPAAESMIPDAMLLLVDGGGSYLLHRGDRLSIGRAASADPADIPIYSDLSERHADVLRVEDDYFMLGANEFEVAGKRTRQQLLRDGDRITLARRAKLTWRMPNRKSASARLDLGDATKMPNDVRRVVLFCETAMIGRGSNCHVNCHTATRDLVLFERGGQMFVRAQGLGGASAVAIEFGKTVELEGVSFVITPWSPGTAGVSRIA